MGIAERLKKWKKQAEQAKSTTLEVGFFETESYPDGEKVAVVAASNEFGAPSRNQPPRPFFRTAISMNKNDWINGLSKMIQNGENFDTALGRIGVRIKEDIQQSIMDFTDPPLSKITIKAKERGDKRRGIPALSSSDAAKPLERTLLMRDSVESKVTKNET